MLNRQDRNYLEYTGFQLLDQIVHLAVSTALYGIFILLFLVSASIFIQRDVKTRSTCSLFSITSITFLLSTLCWTLLLADIVMTIQRTLLNVTITHRLSIYAWPDFTIIYLEVLVPRVLQILGDIVVIWRAWVLSDRQLLLIAVPVLLLVGTCGATIGFLYVYFVNFGEVGYEYLVTHFFVASGALSAATNATSTLVIAWRYFNYRQLLRTTRGGFRSRAQSVLLLLIESGCIYFILQVTNIFLSSDGLPGTRYNDSYNYAMMFFVGMFTQTTAMYPTVVVVLIQQNRSMSDNIQVASPPARQHDTSSSDDVEKSLSVDSPYNVVNLPSSDLKKG